MDLRRDKLKEKVKNESGIRNPKRAAIVTGAGVLAAALLIGGFSLLKSCGGKKVTGDTGLTGMQSVFTEFLEKSQNEAFAGLNGLSAADRERVIAVSIDALERMIGDGKGTYNKQELVTELERVVNELGLGLPAETVHELAEKFVELYSQAFYEIYNDSELTNLTVKQLGDTVTNEMRENLTSITEYLTQLDKEIVNNQDTLEKVIESNDDLGQKLDQVIGEFTKIGDSYASLYNRFSGFEKQLGIFMETFVTNAQGVNNGIVTIQQNINETKEKLLAAEKEITNALAAIESNNVDRQDSIDEQFKGVRESASETRALIRETEKSIQTAISDMSDDRKEEHQEMIDMLMEMEAGLHQTLEKDMAAIEQGFSDLRAGVNSNVNEKTNEIKTQLSGTLNEIRAEFSALHGRLEASEKQFSEFYGVYGNDTERVDGKLNNIRIGITETKARLAATEKSITDILAEMENNNNLQKEELNTEIAEVSDSIEDAKMRLMNVEAGIQETLTLQDITMQENQAELVAALKKLESGIKGVLEEDMSSIVQNFQSIQEEITAELAALNGNLDISVAGLKIQMEDIHSQIAVTQKEIENIVKAMDEKSDMQYKDIMDAVDKAVSRIQSDVNAAYNNLQALIRIFNADMTEQHRDTLDVLEDMESSMTGSMDESLNQITTSFGNLDITLQQYFKEMQESQNATQGALDSVLGELGDNLKENQQVIRSELAAHDATNKTGQEEIRNIVREHNSAALLGQEAIKNTINGNGTDVRAILDAIKISMEEKFNTVFTSVSDGKKKLASALLTKGISIDSDATFEKIKEAILSIPETIEVGGMPGTIKYDYHYHIDSSANRTGNTEHVDVQGGCFTTAVYHTHNDSCYSWSHEHNDRCKSHPIWVDWDGDGYWGKIYDCGDQPANVKGSLKCKLPTSEDGNPIYYERGCGLSDGQIVAAHIIYEGTKDVTSRVIKGEEGEIRAVGVTNEPEYPVPIETQEAEETMEEKAETEEDKGTSEEESSTEDTGDNTGLDESESREEETRMEITESSEETETEIIQTEKTDTTEEDSDV